MIKVEVVLVLVAAYIQRRIDTKIAFIKDNNQYILPREFLTNTTNTLNTAAYLLNRYTGMKAVVHGVGFVHLSQKKLVDNIERTEDGHRCIAVPYLGLIPELVPLPEYLDWIPLSKLSSLPIYNDHAQIAIQALKE
jgi:hypothetical protein